MREFKVNEYITLKLQNDETIIYIAGEKFRKCKYLLLSIPIEEEDLYDEIESIDKAAEKLARSIKGDGIKFEIAPEVEFWGHCSNLQAWAEHNYDTRLLHRNLSFPILKRLTELGDPLAKKFFKEEVAKRIESGHLTVIQFLINQGYLKIFNSEEIETIFYLLNYDKIFERSTFENFLTIVKQFRQIVDENEPYKLLKDKIIETYKSKTVESLLKEDIHILLNFFEKNIWKIFYDDELNKIFEQLNYSKLILKK